MSNLKRMNKGIAKTKRETKRAEAEARQVKYNNLSPAQQVDKLDRRFGKGKGAKKERSRILRSWNKPGDGKSDVVQEIQTEYILNQKR